jgi:hypothetical protein
MKTNAKFWIIGILLSSIGVILARLIAPRFGDQPLFQLILFFLGVVTAMGGLAVILIGLRKREGTPQ